MGNWTIVIHGVGAHHNGKDYDAEVMTDVFAQSLMRAGQQIESVSFTSGGRLELPNNLRQNDQPGDEGWGWKMAMEALEADSQRLVEAVRQIQDDSPLAGAARRFLERYGKTYREILESKRDSK